MTTRDLSPARTALTLASGGLTLAGALLLVSPAAALDGTGTLRIDPSNGWKAFELISEGDDPSDDGDDYSMPGTFDGAGAYLVDANTLRVLVNHETGDASVSEVDLALADLELAIERMIDTGALDGQTFVLGARQAYARWSDDGGASWTDTRDASNTSFGRFCSGQAYAPDTFGSDRGFVDHLYITGEEIDGGRLFALDAASRDFYQLSDVVGDAPGGLGGIRTDSWENAALIDTGETNYVALLLSPDGGTSTLQLYVGEKGKDSSGDSSSEFLARNGLAYGSYYYLAGALPDDGGTSVGGFQTNLGGGLSASKMEDVDTSPSDPKRVVLGNQNFGTFVLDFDLDFSDGFDADSSSFTITEIAAHGSGEAELDSADNVDWTAATVLGGAAYPDGLIFVNEDNSSGQIWQLEPDGSNPSLVGSTNVGAESSGIFDLSPLVGYEPGSVLITNNQGDSSMTVLINPAATPVAGQCGDGICDGDEDEASCPEDCGGGDGDGDPGDGDPGDGDPGDGDPGDPGESGDGDPGDPGESGDESGTGGDAGFDDEASGCSCGAPEQGERTGWLAMLALVGVGVGRRRRARA